jgi:hypothetical protein
MIIYINEKPFNISYYDTKVFIVKRYSIEKGFTIPKYIRIVNQNVFIEKGVSLTIKDVREEFNWLELENLTDQELIEEIIELYPYLVKKDIAVIILYNKYNIDWNKKILDSNILKDIAFLKKIDGFVFFNNIETINIMNEYPENIQKKINILQSEINIRNDIDSFFEKTKPISTEKFLVEELSIRYILELKTEWDLIDIFDSINVSDNIPFIYFKPENLDSNQETVYYKVYDLIDNIEPWVESNKYVPGRIYFKILSSSYSSKKNLDENYQEGVWFDNNNIEISFKLETNNENEYMKKNIAKSVDGRIEYKIIDEIQVGVKGVYIINDFSFNKAILADMISNSYFFTYFLFFNENSPDSKSKFKTITTKERFMFHYEPKQTGSTIESLTVTITPQIAENKKWLDIRIRKATDIYQIESFKFVFSFLLSIYNSNCKSVIKDYKQLLPSTELLFENLSIKEKDKFKAYDKKSGKRLVNLKESRPGVFRPGYASMCQPKKTQPYILDPANVEKYREEYGANKLMEFEDPSTKRKDWYACEPREEGEPLIYIYPGLRKNNIKSKKYNSEVPYVPCCFGEDQYAKAGAELHKRISVNSAKQPNIDLVEMGHILASNKRVPPGRYGSIPFYLAFIAKNSGYSKLEKGKQNIIPIFRYGVEISPDSFFHCMEKAFNPEYSTGDLIKKKELVKNVRIEMSNMNFAGARQELHGYTDDIIRDKLLEENRYMDPTLWHSLAEIKYNCNIFIYKISDEYPNGAVVIPRFSQSYLSKKILLNKNTVFIITNLLDSVNSDCQNEILVKYNNKIKGSKKYKYIFQNDVFINQAVKVFNESINISVISPESYYSYNPISLNAKLFEGIISQYIDSNGKARMLTYNNNISLMTPPFPPFDKEENIEMNIINSKLLDVLDFIKMRNLIITQQYGDNQTKIIKGLWVKSKKSNIDGLIYGYIPIVDSKELENINYSSISLFNLLEVENTSTLNNYRLLRKKAFFLKQYVLYHYSITSKMLTYDNFIVNPNHKYDINSLNKKLILNNPVIYQNGKIIVSTNKTRDNLINFLKISLSVNQEYVMSYANRTIVKNYYEQLSDFRKTSNQLIFDSDLGLLLYFKTKNNIKYHNKIRKYLEPKELSITPFYYRDYKINNGKIAILQQNDFSDLNDALRVSEMWGNDRENGMIEFTNYTGSFEKEVNYIVYTNEGKSEIFNPNIENTSNEIYSLLELEKNKYASLLFL